MKYLVQKQKEFFQSQVTKSISFRISVLKLLRDEIFKREKDIIQAINFDFGKSEFETKSSEIGIVISELNKTIKNLKRWSKPIRVIPSILNFPSTAKIHKEPYGNILIIAPWNYPFNLALVPLIGAIAGGNTVVLKPSELTENTSRIINEIISEVFEEEYIKVVEGGAKVSQDLLRQKWDYIFFTGSVRIGKIVYKAAAEHLTPVTLELGGKSPCIVDETANLKIAARRIVWGKFLNAGQTCIAPDYLIVKNEIKDTFIDLLKKEISKAYGDNPKLSKDYPRIINNANILRLSSMLEDVNVIFGGDTDVNENYVSPTLVDAPSLDSQLMQGEIFGPILPILAYENMDEIEKVINRFPNPLSFYIFSTNKKFRNYFIKKFSFGGGVINDTVVHFINDRLPFGGVGESGLGAYHGKHSFDIFTRPKSIITRYNWPDIPIRYLPSDKFKQNVISFLLMGRK